MDELERGAVPNSTNDDSDGFLPGQRHAAVPATLLLQLNALYQPLTAAITTVYPYDEMIH